MNEEKQPQPTKKFGSISNQFEIIGGGKETSKDTLTQKRYDVKAEEMKRQTVYMPKKLASWLKIYAATTGNDISGIITNLIEELKDKAERESKHD